MHLVLMDYIKSITDDRILITNILVLHTTTVCSLTGYDLGCFTGHICLRPRHVQCVSSLLHNGRFAFWWVWWK